MKYIGNAFSLSMLEGSATLRISEISLDEAKKFNFDVSAIGHKATAEILSVLLEKPVTENRISVKLKVDDEILIFQLLERLPEGKILSIEEMKNIPHKWVLVKIG